MILEKDQIQPQPAPPREEAEQNPTILRLIQEKEKGGNLRDFTDLMMSHDFTKLR